MAIGYLPLIGDEYGPCIEEDCGHRDCAAGREALASICHHCDEAISDRAFHNTDAGLVHAGCERVTTVQINDHTVEANEFAWDGCHKIYVVTNQKGRDQLAEWGYNFFPVAELQKCWDFACGLKFILSADLDETYVSQGYEGEVVIHVSKEVG